MRAKRINEDIHSLLKGKTEEEINNSVLNKYKGLPFDGISIIKTLMSYDPEILEYMDNVITCRIIHYGLFLEINICVVYDLQQSKFNRLTFDIKDKGLQFKYTYDGALYDFKNIINNVIEFLREDKKYRYKKI